MLCVGFTVLPMAASAEEPTASLCAIAAASQYEPGYAVFGHDLGEIDPAIAIPACTEAVDGAPATLDNKAWLARALVAEGRVEDAMPLLEAAVAADNLLARQLLGDILMGDVGEGLNIDEARAVEVLRPAAEAGFAPAELSLGVAYDIGRGIEQDDAEAAKWYERAANQGEARAQGNLGYLYHGGTGVPLDYDKAMHWYTLAAAQNDVIGIYGIGQLYEFGQGVTQDYLKAAEQFRIGAELGDSYAQNDLGYLYDAGLGVTVDPAEAARYYQMASDQGYALASANLAQLYTTGRGVERDFERAFDLYTRAHDQGDLGGTVGLAQAYLYGEGVEIDYEQARTLAQQAADTGASYGQTTLGSIYAEGLGVQRDQARAIELFDLAAEQGNEYGVSRAAEVRAEQACALAAASSYEVGFEFTGPQLEQIDTAKAIPACENAIAHDGVSLENKAWLARALIAGGRQGEAAPLLEEAATGEWVPGMTLLADLLLWGHGTDEDPARAITLYRFAAEHNYAPAMFGLGVAYQNGRGVPVDDAVATEWYRKAEAYYMPAASERLAELSAPGEVRSGPQRAGPKG